MGNVVKLASAGLFIAFAAGAAASSGYKTGYDEGEIDPQLAQLAEDKRQGSIVENTFYETCYGEGELDPRLADAVRSQRQ